MTPGRGGRWLLRLLPRRVRDEYGRDVLETLRARVGEERRRAGRWAAMRYGLHGLVDLLATAARARGRRWRRWRGTSRRPSSMPHWAGLDALALDLRVAFRSLRRAPVFTACSVAVLALGIGFVATLFTVVHGLLLRPLPFAEPERLVMLWERYPGMDADFSTSPPCFADWRARTSAFDGLAAYGEITPSLEAGEWPERITAAAVSADFFRVLGVAPRLGRWLGAADFAPDAAPAVVVGRALWSERFGADPAIVGRTVSLDGVDRVVVGVMGDDFWHFDPYASAAPALWIPMQVPGWGGYGRGDRMLRVVGRLRNGVDLAGASAELDALAASIAREHPDTHEEWGIEAVPMHAEVVDDVRGGVLVLLAAVGLVLLVACGNVANLLLVRRAARNGEVAVRRALGAGALRIARFQLAETTLLALGGGLAGVATASWATAALVAYSPIEVPLADRLGVDASVVAITLLGSLLVGALIALAPVLQGGSGAAATRGAGRGLSAGRGAGRLRDAIVVGEVAMSLVLLSGAGLMIHSLVRLMSVDPGFEPRRALTVEIDLRPEYAQAAEDRATPFFEGLIGALADHPEVTAVGATSHLPFSGWNMTDRIQRADRSLADFEERVGVELRRVTPGYLEAMEVPLRRGRAISSGDRPGSAPVAVVNSVLAELLFGDEEAIGGRLLFSKGGAPERRIVGVVGRIKHRTLAESDRAIAYVPVAQGPPPTRLWLVARGRRDPRALVGEVRGIVRELDPRQPLGRVETLERLVAESFAVERFYSVLLGVFATSALLLAVVGIGGVVSLSVHARVREIGVRMALGARPIGVVRMIVARSLAPAILGIILGIGLSVAATRVLESLLYEITPADPATLIGVAGCLLAASTVASWLPARRAARVDPVVALRAD